MYELQMVMNPLSLKQIYQFAFHGQPAEHANYLSIILYGQIPHAASWPPLVNDVIERNIQQTAEKCLLITTNIVDTKLSS
jgi:hypothetical protein